jgi:ABC-type glycerol-3-phosphate transport system permease component
MKANQTLKLSGLRPRSLSERSWLILSHAVLILLCLIIVFPLFWAVLTSFKPVNEIFTLDLIAKNPTFDNYTAVYQAIPFLQMMVNTFIFAIAVTAGIGLTSVLAAYAFSRWEFRGKNILFLLFAGTLLIPGQITIIPNYLLLAKLGWLNGLLGLTIPQLASGFGVFYLRQHFRSFPKELYDAALMDGAGPLRVLWSIVLPNTRPVLTALSILIFIQTWNEYFWPLLIVKKLNDTVLQVGLQLFLQAEGNAWGPLMAAATMSFLPILVLYIVAQRQIMEAFVRSGIR